MFRLLSLDLALLELARFSRRMRSSFLHGLALVSDNELNNMFEVNRPVGTRPLCTRCRRAPPRFGSKFRCSLPRRLSAGSAFYSGSYACRDFGPYGATQEVGASIALGERGIVERAKASGTVLDHLQSRLNRAERLATLGQMTAGVLESQPGSGTTVRIWLPLKPASGILAG